MPNPIRRRRLGSQSPLPNKAAQLVAASSQFFSIPDNPALSMGAGVDCTFAGWLNPTSMGANRNVFTKSSPTTNIEYGAYLKLSGANLGFFGTNNGSTYVEKINAAVAISNGTWYFLCCQYDGSNLRISVNNGAFQTAALATGLFDGANRFAFGSNDAGDAFWDGLLQDWGIWKSATGAGGVLTTAQVTTLYNNGLGLNFRTLGSLKTNLAAWWGFRGDANDSAGVNHLTNNGGATFVTGR